MTCKDCIGYNFCSDYEKYSEAEVKEFSVQGTVQDLCSFFKNKADVVEVVRCKDCNYWIYWADEKRCSCDLHHIRTHRDDFCSYGERK